MRIQQLDLRAFGPFTGATLDLSGGAQGVHIIVGPNEAGKSSTLRGLRQMLFGFDHLIGDNYLHNEKTLRIGGVLRDEQGNELAFLRRRGKKNTLRSLDDSGEVGDDALKPFLGPLTFELFKTQFGLDHETLSRGSKAALDSGGELGQLLFGVGLDLGGLREFQVRLRSDADELFVSARAHTKLIPSLIQEYKATCEELRANSLPAAEWTEAQEELARCQAERQALETSLEAANRENSRLQRIEDAIPDVSRRSVLLGEWESLKDAVLLRPDFSRGRRDVEESLRAAARERLAATEELAEIARSLDSLVVPDDWLAHEATIRDLHERSGNYAKGSADLIKGRGEQGQLTQGILAILRDLGRPDEFELLQDYRLTSAHKRSIQKSLEDHRALQYELKATRQAYADASSEEAGLAEEQADRSETPETGPLRRAVEKAMKLGEIEKSIQGDRLKLKRLQADWDGDRNRLAVGVPTDRPLETLAVPPVETIELHARRLDLLEAESAKLRDALAKHRAEEKARRRQLATLMKEGDVPTEADLIAARQARDEAWKALKGVWSGPLADAFEQAQIHADGLADRLWREATRVIDLVRCTEALRGCEEDLHAAQAALDQAEARGAEALADWRKLWTGLLDGPPLTPREMTAWRGQVDRLVVDLRQLDELRDQLAQREEQASDAWDSLVYAANDLGHPISRRKSLAITLDECQDLLKQFQEKATRRELLTQKLGDAKRKVREARQANFDVEEQLSLWLKAWGRAVAPIGLDETATTERVGQTLESYENLAKLSDKLTALNDRIRGTEHEQAEFEEDARDLLSRIAPDLVGESPVTAVKQCWTRLDAAKAAKARRDHLLEEREKHQRSLRNATRELADAKEKLSALCAEASCDDPAGLAEREERSARRRIVEKELAELAERLSRSSGSGPLEAFVDEASSHDLDTVRARRMSLDEEIKRLESRRVEIDQSIGAIDNQIRAMEGRSRDGKAEGSAAKAQHLLVKISTHVEQFSRLRLASAILGQVIERYRQAHQAPLLAKAADYFRGLTGGAFDGLRADLDERGKPRLIGLRGAKNEEVEIDGMSTGTVDQLYLALKLASLEHYLDSNPPMPFIIDDVLVQFDDDRALAALRAFATLSARTQIIFFTHHRHLADLARRELPADVLFVHSLQRRGAGGFVTESHFTR